MNSTHISWLLENVAKWIEKTAANSTVNEHANMIGWSFDVHTDLYSSSWRQAGHTGYLQVWDCLGATEKVFSGWWMRSAINVRQQTTHDWSERTWKNRLGEKCGGVIRLSWWISRFLPLGCSTFPVTGMLRIAVMLKDAEGPFRTAFTLQIKGLGWLRFGRFTTFRSQYRPLMSALCGVVHRSMPRTTWLW